MIVHGAPSASIYWLVIEMGDCYWLSAQSISMSTLQPGEMLVGEVYCSLHTGIALEELGIVRYEALLFAEFWGFSSVLVFLGPSVRKDDAMRSAS